MNTHPDFIIVGGGTSGLVVAARLTEDPNTSVLVVEAGNEHTGDPRLRTPAFWLSVLGSPDFDWDYKSVPQKGLDGKVIPLSQGKLVGGSSAINGLAFVANSKAAIDGWGSFGNPGWNWDTLRPYYNKFHTLSRPSVSGTAGPVQASFPEETKDPLPSAWVDTIAGLGYSATSDPFSGQFPGGYINALSVDPLSRTRSDAATAYFEPIKTRPNLQVVTGALAERILFNTTANTSKAVGIKVQKDSQTVEFTAKKEVILSAGVFGTPKLLELSGVGNRDLLQPHGIQVIYDNPNVGENLQDHPVSRISFEVESGVQTIDALARQDPEAVGAAMQEYLTNKTGPFAVGNYTGSLLPVPDFTGPNGKSALENLLHQVEASNLDAHTGPFTPHHTSVVHSLLSNPTESVANIFMYAAVANVNPTNTGSDIIATDDTPGNFITICAALLFPLSRGSSHISSSNPADKPSIDPHYLEHPLDLEVQARLLRYAETIIRAEPLSGFVKGNGRRNPGVPADLSDLEVAKQYAKASALSCWHPTSTCAMLPLEKGGVVGPSLRVYGVEGLRIVDASIIRLATRGNPQTTVYAVAERAADLIKQEYGIVA